jgi:hypothetical protein
MDPIALSICTMNWIFNLQKSISKLIFAGYAGSKNPVRNRLKYSLLNISNLIFQKSSTDGCNVNQIFSKTPLAAEAVKFK